jgi:ABC-type sulfate/molybdate transport systems ATPase subunit
VRAHPRRLSPIPFPRVIAGIDGPKKGLIGVSQQPMKDLIESMN